MAAQMAQWSVMCLWTLPLAGAVMGVAAATLYGMARIGIMVVELAFPGTCPNL